ncbi:MAG: 16S rRNA (guanine(966)-N(2))-methyltransferase RsmD [Pseudomonadota bacterium]
MPLPQGKNRVRLIGGRHGGRRLQFPAARGLRPTADRVRETLFNWLQQDIVAARCLDLFAGSGALGFEAASRGAEPVMMVERQRDVFRALQQNRALLQLEDAVQLVNADALTWLHGTPEMYQLVFLDPPFNKPLLQPVIDQLERGGWLAPGALVYLEQDLHVEPPQLPDNWRIIRNKTAGQVRYQLVERTER